MLLHFQVVEMMRVKDFEDRSFLALVAEVLNVGIFKDVRVILENALTEKEVRCYSKPLEVVN